jgi:DNA-binding MarR family transcriptional regulator
MATIVKRKRLASDGLGSDLDIHLGYWLRLISNQVSATFARNLQAKGVSVAEWVALSLIAQVPSVASATLADEMGMTPGGVSKVLDKLTAKESIDRATSPADSRVQMLSLTRTGRRMLPALRKVADDNDEHFFSALDGGERVILKRLLEKLADAQGLNKTPVN